VKLWLLILLLQVELKPLMAQVIIFTTL
jgi:hypothetical protein